jgi:photosystem II stability/assembly factor-like uncharacterized protein
MAHVRQCLLLVAFLTAGYASATAQVYWDSSYVGTDVTLFDMCMLNSQLGIVAGDGGLVARTTDGGVSWTPSASSTPGQLVAVALADSSIGAVGGSNILFNTTDGGITWSTPTFPVLSSIRGIAFNKKGIGIAVGANAIRRSTDGGKSWSTITPPGSPTLSRVSFLDSNRVVAVGSGTVVIGSTDAGQSWTPIRPSSSGLLSDLCVASTARVIAAGTKSSQGFILQSSDAGTTWDSVVVSQVSQLVAVSYFTVDSGYALASNRKLLETVDGGLTWDSIATVPRFASRVWFGARRSGLVAAYNGKVYLLKTTPVGVSPEPSVPGQFVLYQNYPNPFNPSTTIEYQLPKASLVRLSVYDILGREVSVLLNETRDAGTHELKFDASGLSSGVYLYRLEAGDLSQTRRMLVLK